MSAFICPICAAPLCREETRYHCGARHSYDIAREGYVHLLPANRKHSANPGDDKAMVAARARFLSGGWYAPLRNSLCTLALARCGSSATLLDAGCGEGYYTAGIFSAFQNAGCSLQVAGVDLSKPALKLAARRIPEGEFAVASVYHLPVADAWADLLLDCFAPLAAEEYARVLKPGGTFLYVVPAPEHLWELKEVLYEKPYKNAEEETNYPGFTLQEIVPVQTRLHLNGEDAADLFHMTPYTWKTPKAGAQRLQALPFLDVTAAFRIHVFSRT